MQKVDIIVYNFAYELSKADLLPYEHNETVSGTCDDAFSIARGFFEKGINVMLYRRKASRDFTEAIIVYVDNKRFQQR